MFSRRLSNQPTFIDQTNDSSSVEFFECIKNKDITQIKNYFGNPNLRVWEFKQEDDYTCLHKAVFMNDLDIVQVILYELKKRLGLGANAAMTKFVNEKTTEGITALHYAAYKGNVEIAKLLILNGANSDAASNRGKNVMHLAAEGNQPSMMIYFMSYENQDIFSIDDCGSTPLHWACYSGAEEAVLFLLSLNANINAKDKEGLTPLHLSVIAKKEKIVLRLLQKGADKTISNNNGEIPYDLAKKKNYYEIMYLLMDKDYNPLCTLESPIEKIETNDVYKKFIWLMILVPELIDFFLIEPFLEGIIHTIVNLSAFGVTVLLYLVLLGKEPGYKVNEELLKESSGEYVFKSLSDKGIDIKPYCPTCLTKKSPNIRHCFVCEKCVENFSHHCFWLNCCIGKGNKVIYFLFIFFSQIYALHSLFMCFELFFDDVNLPYEKSFPPSWFNFGMDDRGFRILGAAIVAVSSSIVGFVLSFLVLVELFKCCNLFDKKASHNSSYSQLSQEESEENKDLNKFKKETGSVQKVEMNNSPVEKSIKNDKEEALLPEDDNGINRDTELVIEEESDKNKYKDKENIGEMNESSDENNIYNNKTFDSNISNDN